MNLQLIILRSYYFSEGVVLLRLFRDWCSDPTFEKNSQIFKFNFQAKTHKIFFSWCFRLTKKNNMTWTAQKI